MIYLLSCKVGTIFVLMQRLNNHPRGQKTMPTLQSCSNFWMLAIL